MNSEQSVIIGTDSGLKSIPLNKLPESAWTYVTGKPEGFSAAEDVMARYKDIPWLYRGINARVNAHVAVEHTISPINSPDEELQIEDEIPWLDDFLSYIEMFVRWYILYGRAYAKITYNYLNQPMGFEPMHPEVVKPIWGKNGDLASFERKLPKGGKQPLALEDVWYWWKTPEETEKGWGTPDAHVAMKASGVLYYTDVHSQRLFASGAINPTIVSLSNGTGEADRQRIESFMQRTLGGIKRAFGISAVIGDVKTTSIGQDLDKLSVPTLTRTKREDVATALGVPQTKLFSMAANYATARQDSLQMYEDTVKPDDRRLVGRLNKLLFKPLGYVLTSHFDRLEIYQASEADKGKGLGALVKDGIIDANEARVELGYEAREEEPPPPEPQPPPAAPVVISADAIQPAEEPVAKDLSTWRRMALRRLKEGHPQKALGFSSDHIPATTQGAIRGALRSAKTAEDIHRIFNHAAVWHEYP